MKITKDTLIVDIIRQHPAVNEVLEKHHMGCASCLGVQSETLEKGCMMHGLDVDAMLKEINTKLK